jgi:hypothetical protein
MDHSEKLARQGTQDEEEQNKNTTQYVLETTMLRQTQMTHHKLDMRRPTNNWS